MTGHVTRRQIAGVLKLEAKLRNDARVVLRERVNARSLSRDHVPEPIRSLHRLDRVDYVDYKDVMTLRKFVSERGKIRARRVSGNCVQHQRDVATAVKNAREMALLPYSAR